MKKNISKRKIIKEKLFSFITYIGLGITVVFFIYCIKNQIFNSPEKMQAFLNRFGIAAPIVFVIIQAVQVVFPIIPGSVGCGIGILFWGPLEGFIYNYVGICIGSIIAFLLAEKYGRKFVENIIGEEKYLKYNKWLDEKINFKKIFVSLMFFPFGPDDLLCYFAGLTKMKTTFFIIILLLSKPLSIIIYSYFLIKSFNILGIGG